jgi:hypothetical protein
MASLACRTKQNYVTFARISTNTVATGPEESKYYSEEKQGVYYLYQYVVHFTFPL